MTDKSGGGDKDREGMRVGEGGGDETDNPEEKKDEVDKDKEGKDVVTKAADEGMDENQESIYCISLEIKKIIKNLNLQKRGCFAYKNVSFL